MNEQTYIRRMQMVSFGGALILLVLLVLAWTAGASGKEWRRVQKEQAEAVPGLETGIREIGLPGLGTTDRCVTCHPVLEDPRFDGNRPPLAAHPGAFLTDHPVDDYGCTVCHGGQGRALNKREAFAQDPGVHWPHPMLEQPFIQSSCGRCHLALFPGESGPSGDTLSGTGVLARGRDIFAREGCLGCHIARGVGGILGPDLTRQGEKTRHDYSFENVEGEQSISHWLKEHFRDPETVSPGSQMLKVDLAEEELDALATLVMGLSKPDMPLDYFSLEVLKEFKGTRHDLNGETAFQTLCSACHGKRGEGKDYATYRVGVPSLGNVDFQRLVSREYLRFTLEQGRSLRQMGTWSTDVSGLRSAETADLVGWLKYGIGRAVEAKPAESAEAGSDLYARHCATCHGDNGQGGIGVALNQDGLLHVATDDMLRTTLAQGRGNTAMPGWQLLGDEALDRLVAWVRTWGTYRHVFFPDLPEGREKEGSLLFHFSCSRCHGEFGEGGTGPAVVNRDFLAAAPDPFLVRTISEGRAHTAMFGWTSELVGGDRLDLQDLADLLAFLRARATEDPDYIHSGANPGSQDPGSLGYARLCAECHGNSGEGTRAPALNNQELLNAASNGYLLGTITLGRSGTPMPSWGYATTNRAALDPKERTDLVAFLRSWQKIRIPFPGTQEAGVSDELKNE
ncbi:MAG: c-type cytochrome [Bacteroidales bacterium]